MNRNFHIIVFAITLLAYLSVYVSPAAFWLAGFASLSIPVLLLVNVTLVVLYFVRLRRLAIFPLLAIVLGYQYVSASISWHITPDRATHSFSVLSYNVRVFNIYAHLRPQEKSRPMIEWLTQEDADVKCLQEFYNNDSSTSFNTTQILSKQGEYQSYVRPSLINRVGAEFGLAIFSRHPVINRGEVSLDNVSQYAIYADIRTPADTVRVYNVHLRSMSIDENTLGNQEEYPSIARKLRNGFTARAQQVDHLLEHIKQSPHPVVVGGDMNDIPYSYSYFALKGSLENAFEQAGRGFGFSYNGRLFFLRIDHQFFSQGLSVERFFTYQDVGFSDHFPIKAVYSFQ